MARKPTATRPKKAVHRVDFTGVELGGARHIPDDDYLVEVESVEQEEGNEYPYWKWKLKVADGGDHDGTVLYHNTSLNPKSLWALRQWLECLGVEVPQGPVDIDFDELAGLTLAVTTSTEVYEGKKRSKITDYAEASGEPEEPEEKPAPKGKTEKKAKKVTYSSDEIGDMEEEQLQALVDKHNLEVDLDALKSIRKKQNAIIDALEEQELIVD